MRRHDEPIDILKLYSGRIVGFEDNAKWNAWLSKCLRNNDLDELVRVRYRLQLGMADLEKKNLVTEKIAETWCRWIGSIEKTMRRIVKQRELYANDLIAKDHHSDKQLGDKRTRDQAFEKYLRKKSY